MRILLFVSLLALISCTHKELSKTDLPLHPDPCFTAAANNDIPYLQAHLEVCKNTKTQYGTTPLMLAAAKGRDNVISFLLGNGMDINEVDNDGGTALNYAVIAKQVSSAGLLILSGVELESKRPDGITPLMSAIQLSSPEMVHTLTTTRQAINAKAEDGWTALYFAVRRQDPSILNLLLRQGACKNTIDSYKQSPLDFAKEVGWQQGAYMIEKAPACGSKRN